jgi:L-cysteine S-thiosulfotransferase
MKNPKTIALPMASLCLAGCAAMGSAPDYDALLANMMRTSFRSEGIATTDRLVQDKANAACSQAQSGNPPDGVVKEIEQAALESVVAPTDGRYLGDWREGEKLAQNGRGMTWSDKSSAPQANGGNCLNCHQVTKEEVSFGTIGPSLYHYGRDRGVTDPSSAAARPIVQYTWGKIYNARAYNACSGMPRFGHAKLLNQTQMQDLMALLLDPKSPVNQ